MPSVWPWHYSFGFAALVVVVAALLIRLAGPMGSFTPALLLFMACVVTARVAGFSASLLSIALGAVAFQYFLSGWTSGASLLTFLVASVLSCAVTASLRTTRIHLARVLDSISDAFAIIDRKWRIQFVNRRAAEILKRPADDLIGRHLFDVFPELAQSPIVPRLDRAHAEGRPLHVEAHYPPLDVWFEATLVVTPDGVLAFARDITERKNDEAQLRSTLEIVSHSNEEMRHFASAVTHDYVQPLNAIVTFAELIRSETRGDVQRHAQRIMELIHKASTLARLYSDFSKPPDELSQLVPISLGTALERSREEFASTFASGKVEIVTGELPAVRAHVELLALFFRHLIGFVLSARTAAGVRIRITAEAHDDDWAIRVTPTYVSPGAVPNTPHAESLRRGRLAVCRGIIERHDGRFWTEDDGGVTTVVFTLPAAREPARIPN
jgi:PAS domain S-box-containing protein